MRVTPALALVILTAACMLDHTRANITEPTSSLLRADQAAVSAPRPVLWILNGRVLGRAADPRELMPDHQPIDPARLLAVEVIKGAAAVSKYGSDASNGVIALTTK